MSDPVRKCSSCQTADATIRKPTARPGMWRWVCQPCSERLRGSWYGGAANRSGDGIRAPKGAR